MNNKKKKTIIVLAIIFTIIGAYFTFFKGFYAFSDKVVGPYKYTEIYEDFISYESWVVGENRYGDPIFCHKDNGYQFTKLKYTDELNKIHEEYGVSKLNKRNVKTYIDILDKISSFDAQENKRYEQLNQLLNLYANCQKRWVYVIGTGFERIVP